jgi:hypothetical protein
MGTAKDDTYVRGNLGFGFNEGSNGDYGISRFSAAATDGSSFMTSNEKRPWAQSVLSLHGPLKEAEEKFQAATPASPFSYLPLPRIGPFELHGPSLPELMLSPDDGELDPPKRYYEQLLLWPRS